MDWQQSGKERRERRCRASISGPTRPHAPSAFRGAPCRPGSPPGSSAFAGLVARYFSPLRTFKPRLTATASRPSASRDRAVSQSRPARSPGRCWPPAVSRQRANTECNASRLSQPHCSQPPTARALLPTPAPSCGHDHQSRHTAPPSLHDSILAHSRSPARPKPHTHHTREQGRGRLRFLILDAPRALWPRGKKWQIELPFIATWCFSLPVWIMRISQLLQGLRAYSSECHGVAKKGYLRLQRPLCYQLHYRADRPTLIRGLLRTMARRCEPRHLCPHAWPKLFTDS